VRFGSFALGAEAVRALAQSGLHPANCRLLDAAEAAFAQDGWRKLTMARVADRAGVSRQTVYNEFGTKQALAEQMVLRELGVFLDVVAQRFTAEVGFGDAIAAAVDGALTTARKNDLLRSVLESAHSGDSELLPIILQSRDQVDRATEFLFELVRSGNPDFPLDDDRLMVALESVVRLVLSHISSPSHPDDKTVADISWAVETMIAGVASST
jgi:AcrR family transcriptional regulator